MIWFFMTNVGTTKLGNLVANIGSLRVKLTKDVLKEISDAVPVEEVAGVRYFFSHTAESSADTQVKK